MCTTINFFGSAKRPWRSASMMMPANSDTVVIYDQDKKYELRAPVDQPPSFVGTLVAISLEEHTKNAPVGGDGPTNVFMNIHDIVPLTRSGRRVTITFDAVWTSFGVDHSKLMDAVFVAVD